MNWSWAWYIFYIKTERLKSSKYSVTLILLIILTACTASAKLIMNLHVFKSWRALLTVDKEANKEAGDVLPFPLLHYYTSTSFSPQQPSCLSTEENRLSIVEKQFGLFVWSTSKCHHLLCANVIECVGWQYTCLLKSQRDDLLWVTVTSTIM